MCDIAETMCDFGEKMCDIAEECNLHCDSTAATVACGARRSNPGLCGLGLCTYYGTYDLPHTVLNEFVNLSWQHECGKTGPSATNAARFGLLEVLGSFETRKFLCFQENMKILSKIRIKLIFMTRRPLPQAGSTRFHSFGDKLLNFHHF